MFSFGKRRKCGKFRRRGQHLAGGVVTNPWNVPVPLLTSQRAESQDCPHNGGVQKKTLPSFSKLFQKLSVTLHKITPLISHSKSSVGRRRPFYSIEDREIFPLGWNAPKINRLGSFGKGQKFDQSWIKAVSQDTAAGNKHASSRNEEKSALAPYLEGK